MTTLTPTTGSKVGVVYSTGKKHVRRHIYVDSDAEWPAIEASLAPGESIAFVPMSAHLSGFDAYHQAVATAIGVATVGQMFTDPRCVVIDDVSNVVEHVIMADDSIDTMPGKTLVNHQIAKVGDSYDHALKQFTAPSFTLQPKPGVRATAVTVPASVFS